MRILFVSDAYIPVPTGVAVSVETLRISLEKLGSSVFIVAPKYPRWKKKERGVARLPGLFRPFEKYKASVWPVFGLDTKKLKEFKIDIVHSHFFFRPFNYPIELAKSLKIPLVNTFYRIFPEGERLTSSIRAIANRRASTSIRKMIDFSNQSDSIIALSQTSKKYLSQFSITPEIKVLPVGIFPKDYSSFPPEAIRRKFSIAQNRKIILYVGSADREGEIPFLIRSFKKVWKALDDVHLLIIGGGDKLKDYKIATSRLSIGKFITFTDYLPKKQVNKIYGVADIFAYPGRLDPEPLVILESLAAGTPVVAVEGMGAQEFIKENEDGFVTKPQIDDFSDALIDILKKDKMRLDFSLKARINARQYRASILSRELLDLYESQIANYKNKFM